MKIKKTIFTGFILFISIFIFSACQSNQLPIDYEQLSEKDRIVIRFSHIVGENTPKGLAARKFAQLVKERTDGYVEVQVFPNGYLYRDGEEMDALLAGDIQMIAPAMSKLSMLDPEWEVMDLPFAFENSEQVFDYLSGVNGVRLLNNLKVKGVYPLAIWDNGFKQMTSNVHPLIKPEDFVGLRFRIMSSSVLEEQFRQLAASTQIHSFNEVYQIIENDKVNGQENTFSNIYSKNLHLMQPFVTVSNHGYLGYVVLMNREFWMNLPEEIQSIIESTMAEVTEWEREIAKKLNEESLEQIIDCECVELHYLTEEEKLLWEQALEPVYEYYSDRFGANYIKGLPKNNK